MGYARHGPRASPQGQTEEMSLLQIQALFAKPFSHILASNSSSFSLSYRYPSSFTVSLPQRNLRRCPKSFIPFEASATPDQNPNSNPNPRPSTDPPKPKGRRSKPKSPAGGTATAASGDAVLSTIPRKPRRDRQSEAAAMEDFIQDRLEGTFTSIREQNAGVLEGKEEALKQTTLKEEEGESSRYTENRMLSASNSFRPSDPTDATKVMAFVSGMSILAGLFLFSSEEVLTEVKPEVNEMGSEEGDDESLGLNTLSPAAPLGNRDQNGEVE